MNKILIFTSGFTSGVLGTIAFYSIQPIKKFYTPPVVLPNVIASFPYDSDDYHPQDPQKREVQIIEIKAIDIKTGEECKLSLQHHRFPYQISFSASEEEARRFVYRDNE